MGGSSADFTYQYTLITGYGGVLELRCGTDQVGTLKVLTDASGRLFKEIHRNSFGVRRYDSLPELFIPIGFAGGLEDPDTGLVRFGYRDYDPLVGRFTAPDPARDLRGDADLYDYCADDPVNRKRSRAACGNNSHIARTQQEITRRQGLRVKLRTACFASPPCRSKPNL